MMWYISQAAIHLHLHLTYHIPCDLRVAAHLGSLPEVSSCFSIASAALQLSAEVSHGCPLSSHGVCGVDGSAKAGGCRGFCSRVVRSQRKVPNASNGSNA